MSVQTASTAARCCGSGVSPPTRPARPENSPDPESEYTRAAIPCVLPAVWQHRENTIGFSDAQWGRLVPMDRSVQAAKQTAPPTAVRAGGRVAGIHGWRPNWKGFPAMPARPDNPGVWFPPPLWYALAVLIGVLL